MWRSRAASEPERGKESCQFGTARATPVLEEVMVLHVDERGVVLSIRQLAAKLTAKDTNE